MKSLGNKSSLTIDRKKVIMIWDSKLVIEIPAGTGKHRIELLKGL
jgi:hypothetical protein